METFRLLYCSLPQCTSIQNKLQAKLQATQSRVCFCFALSEGYFIMGVVNTSDIISGWVSGQDSQPCTSNVCLLHISLYKCTYTCAIMYVCGLKRFVSTGEDKWAVALKCLIRLGCLVQRLTVYTVATVNNQPANLWNCNPQISRYLDLELYEQAVIMWINSCFFAAGPSSLFIF